MVCVDGKCICCNILYHISNYRGTLHNNTTTITITIIPLRLYEWFVSVESLFLTSMVLLRRC